MKGDLILATTGAFCVGKDVALHAIHGRYAHFKLSLASVLREALKPFNREKISRQDLAAIGIWARAHWGEDAIIHAYLRQIAEWFDEEGRTSSAPLVGVVDALRTVPDLVALRKHAKNLGVEMRVIAIVSDDETRFQRWLKRARSDDRAEEPTRESFRAMNNHPGEQGVPGCIELADIVIENNGSVEDFRASIERYVQSLGFNRQPEGD